jgi:hypothetical protein
MSQILRKKSKEDRASLKASSKAQCYTWYCLQLAPHGGGSCGSRNNTTSVRIHKLCQNLCVLIFPQLSEVCPDFEAGLSLA